MMKKLLAILALLHGNLLIAQDAHFSQFENSPFFINPGSAGMLEYGNYRANLSTRNQWRKLVKPSVNTIISADCPILRYMGQSPSKSYVGIGAYYSFAKTGDSKTKQNGYGVAINGVTTIGKGKQLGLGIGAGRGSLRGNLSNATWDAQYDGYGYNSALPSNEALEGNYRAKYWDFSTGLNYLSVHRKTGNATNMGVSYSHLNNPKLKKTSLVSGRIDPRLIFHLRTEIGLQLPKTLPMYLIPRFMFINQGAHNQMQAGLSLFIVTNEISQKLTFHHKEGIEMGAMYRHNDAVGILVGYKAETWKLGVCYDITISGLGEAINNRGGAELSFIWIGFNPNVKQKQTFY